MIEILSTILGSFLAVVTSLGIWSYQEKKKERKARKDNLEEIRSIFLMAARESELALQNMNLYISAAREGLKNLKEMGNITPPRFSVLYINEERLFVLKNGLPNTLSQQIDIAISAAKVINGYSETYESAPQNLFDTCVKLIQAGMTPKEEAVTKYVRNMNLLLKNMEVTLSTHFLTAQRHVLRPVIGCEYINDKEFWSNITEDNVDEILDERADLFLAYLKENS